MLRLKTVIVIQHPAGPIVTALLITIMSALTLPVQATAPSGFDSGNSEEDSSHHRVTLAWSTRPQPDPVAIYLYTVLRCKRLKPTFTHIPLKLFSRYIFITSGLCVRGQACCSRQIRTWSRWEGIYCARNYGQESRW